MKTAEQNFDWLDKQVEGLLNDFDSGESTLEETKNGFYEIIFDKLIKQIQEQQDYKQEINEACKKAKIEVYQECSEKAIEYQYGKLGGLAMTLFLQDRIKELKGE